MANHPPTSLMSDVRLRDVTEADLPILFEHQRDPDANQMAAFPARDWDAFMAHWKRILADDTVVVRTAMCDGDVAGSIVCWERDCKRLIGYWIGKSYWGKGIATKALGEFLRIVKTRPLYAHVAKRNVASIRVLEKCGFTICDERTTSRDVPGDGIEEHVYKLGTSENR